MALIFVMVDGLGLGPAGAQNPVPGSMPWLARTLDAPLDPDLRAGTSNLFAAPIDATLGVPGLPQSGSGHTAIYGGYNAAVTNGRHQPSYPTIAMREELRRRNLLSAAQQQGATVAWANAYLPGYTGAVERRHLRHTAGTWSALYAGLELRGLADLLAGTAVSWDIDQSLARTRPGCQELARIEAQEAGRRLASLAHEHALVAFETYLPDLAGHERVPFTPSAALRLVDGLIEGAVTAKHPEDTLVVTSDHGNAEDAGTRVHTRNPVPLIALGPVAPVFAAVRAIDGVMAAILEGLRGI